MPDRFAAGVRSPGRGPVGCPSAEAPARAARRVSRTPGVGWATALAPRVARPRPAVLRRPGHPRYGADAGSDVRVSPAAGRRRRGGRRRWGGTSTELSVPPPHCGRASAPPSDDVSEVVQQRQTECQALQRRHRPGRPRGARPAPPRRAASCVLRASAACHGPRAHTPGVRVAPVTRGRRVNKHAALPPLFTNTPGNVGDTSSPPPSPPGGALEHPGPSALVM